jgi:cobalt/nickel transport system permease protein
MTGSLALLDYLASAGRSPWHRMSAVSKMALLAALLACVVTMRWLPALLGTLGLAVALGVTARLPARVLIGGAAYPLLFTSLYALSRLDGTWTTPLALLARAATAGLGAVWLVGTTPYPDLFAPLSRVLPHAVGDGLFLTYRAFFALATRAEHLWRALRLRGGLAGASRQHVLRAPAALGEALGTLVLHSFERSQRLHGALRLRGHEGRICGCRHFAEARGLDALPWTLAVLLVVAAIGQGRLR